MASFPSRLQQTVERCGTALCIGFDPQPGNMPQFALQQATSAQNDEELATRALGAWGDALLDALENLVGVVKPNAAFFEQFGVGGVRALHRLCASAKERGLVVILDAKRGDIGHSASAYAASAFGGAEMAGRRIAPLAIDALTVNPYLGPDTLAPMIAAALEHDGGLFILVRTSNPGAATFQGEHRDAEALYRRIAEWVATQSNATRGNEPFSAIGAVVGATYPDEAAQLRAMMPHTPFLMPGLGAQGAAADGIRAGFTAARSGAVVNASRAAYGDANAVDRAAYVADCRERIESLRAQLDGVLSS